MSQLVPCLHCDRHVRVVETRCPFCEGALPGAAAVAARPARGRMSRAAMLAVGATLAGGPTGCAKDPPTRDDAGLSPSDALDSAAAPDGGTDAVADALVPPDSIIIVDASGRDADIDRGPILIYGAAPIPQGTKATKP